MTIINPLCIVCGLDFNYGIPPTRTNKSEKDHNNLQSRKMWSTFCKQFDLTNLPSLWDQNILTLSTLQSCGLPFCPQCKIELRKLHSLNEELETILEKMNKVTVSLKATLVSSFKNNVNIIDPSSIPSSSQPKNFFDGIQSIKMEMPGNYGLLNSLNNNNHSLRIQVNALRSHVAQKYLPIILVPKLEMFSPHKSVQKQSRINSGARMSSQDFNNDEDDDVESNISFVDDSCDENYKPGHSLQSKKRSTKTDISLKKFKLFNQRRRRTRKKHSKALVPAKSLHSRTLMGSGMDFNNENGKIASINLLAESTLEDTNQDFQVVTPPLDVKKFSYNEWVFTQNYKNGPFQCSTCNVETTSRERMHIHIRNIHCPEECTYKCEECNVGFESRQRHDAHQRLHEKAIFVTKVGCPDTFVYENRWEFVQVDNNEYRCSTCDFSDCTTFKMTQHIHNLHHAPPRAENKCLVCQRSFRFPSLLRSHEKQNACSRSRRLPFEKSVEIGNGQWSYKGIWLFGQKHKHGQFHCLTCGQDKRTKSHMIRHIQIKHCPAMKKYECGLCDKSFQFHSQLKAHKKKNTCGSRVQKWKAMKTENGLGSSWYYEGKWPVELLGPEGADWNHSDSRFQCLTCGRICKTRALMAIHIRKRHIGESDIMSRRSSTNNLSMVAASTSFGENVQLSYKDKWGYALTTLSDGGSGFRCDTCGVEKKSRERMHIHIRSLHCPDECKFRCSECNIGFESLKVFELHEKQHKVKRHVAKENCPGTFIYNGTHEFVQVGDEDNCYQCSTCDMTCSSLFLIGQHIRRIHKADASRECLKCRRKFRFPSSLKAHQAKNSCGRGRAAFQKSVSLGSGQFCYKGKWLFCAQPGSDAMQCETCGVVKSSRGRMIIHIKNRHCPEDCSFKCTECNIGFESQMAFEAHEKNHALKQPTPKEGCPGTFIVFGKWEFEQVGNEFRCSTCNFSTYETTTMIQHVQLDHHALPRGHRCLVCKKSFRFQSVLRAHLKKNSCTPARTYEKSADLGGGTFSYKDKWMFTLLDPNDKDGPVRCEACGEEKKDRRAIMVHIKSIHCPEECTYRCDECSIGFTGRLNLINHKRLYHQSKSFEPKPDCPGVFIQAGRWEFVQIGQNEYQCSDCGHTTNNLYRISQHVQKTHIQQAPPPRPVNKCPVCKKSFKFPSLLRAHINKNSCVEGSGWKTNQRSVDLGNGKYSYKDKWIFTLINSKSEPVFRCEECGEEKKERGAMVLHIKTVHTPQDCTFLCTLCNLGMEGQQALDKHKKKFHEEKSYKPKENCPNTFVHDDEWDFVQNSSNEFQCSSCGVVTADDVRMIQHIENVHRDPNKFICKDCGKRCKNIGGLNLHQLTHRRFKCNREGCDKVFQSKSNLVNHQHYVHVLGSQSRVGNSSGTTKSTTMVKKSPGEKDFVSRVFSRSRLKKKAKLIEPREEEEYQEERIPGRNNESPELVKLRFGNHRGHIKQEIFQPMIELEEQEQVELELEAEDMERDPLETDDSGIKNEWAFGLTM